ncbi:cobalt ECF transporter T component CbiQ [Thioflexithrix psekupsensis]|uniref:Cobalt ECF transporter T component CbiQ n=1 Tax=Thioflexithrix psekupsensis TaxID=1570016 RepID=A0A251X5T7_9GAMM|nr:cobalt ECF transporter T component CbiQ [Thioflexithrix psekupsensis]OUD12512.1 cobalt ECF transporter T component CbiQ [Thioflexithrix psekupsensis]
MSIHSLPLRGDSLVHALDPRIRFILTLAFALWLVLQQQGLALLTGLLLGMGFVALAQLPYYWILIRLLPINLFMVLLFLILPVTLSGNTVITLGHLTLSDTGFIYASHIFLRANAMMLTMVALIGTLDLITLGHALAHLKVPTKLIHLLLFTVRYLSVLYATWQQLALAMKVRGFIPRANWHTYRSMGYLLGMLLVRSFLRAQRVEWAMKCRGYHGQFYLLSHFYLKLSDAVFLLIFSVILLTLSVYFAWLQ